MSSDSAAENLMTIEQAAAYVALSRSTIYELIAAKEIPTMRFGRSVRIRPSDMRDWVDRLAVIEPAARADAAGQGEA